MTLSEMLIAACSQRASDMVLAGGAAPTVWIRGQMGVLAGFTQPLGPGQVERLFRPLLSDVQQARLRQSGDLDWSAPLAHLLVEPGSRGAGPAVTFGAGKAAMASGKGGEDEATMAPAGRTVLMEDELAAAGRVRINLHRQRGDWAAALRFIPRQIPALESLRLPEAVAGWIDRPRGLVLVTGPTGAGKSTTLAAMIQRANEYHDYHVITLEDPIEYEFDHGTCLIEQRQIGEDSPAFADALRHVVRQRPDVILVGELRDRETIAAALTAAETGHLVLGTLHTNSAPATVERIMDAFDHSRQGQIRLQLAGSLQCILCQTLLRDRIGGGLIPATEVLVATTAIRRAIRDGQPHLIDAMLETGQALGMHSLEQDLARLLAAGRISLDDAMSVTSDPEKLNNRRRNNGGAK